MKIKNILLLLSLFFILILIFLSQTATNKETGKISEIKYSDNKITIILEDKEEKLIIFDKCGMRWVEASMIIHYHT